MLTYILPLVDLVFPTTGGSKTRTVNSYKDLGITVTPTLSWSEHIRIICKRAYSSLHTIRRVIPSKSTMSLRKRLYLSNIRSHVTYGSQVWNPHLLKDINNLEKIQRRATKFILQDSTLSYRDRLIQTGLLPLTMWLELQDILFLVKHIKEPSDNYNILDHVRFRASVTRSSTTTTARHFYYNRIVRLWNRLPEINLEHSVASIKANVTKFLWNHFLHYFDPSNTSAAHVHVVSHHFTEFLLAFFLTLFNHSPASPSLVSCCQHVLCSCYTPSFKIE